MLILSLIKKLNKSFKFLYPFLPLVFLISVLSPHAWADKYCKKGKFFYASDEPICEGHPHVYCKLGKAYILCETVDPFLPDSPRLCKKGKTFYWASEPICEGRPHIYCKTTEGYLNCGPQTTTTSSTTPPQSMNPHPPAYEEFYGQDLGTGESGSLGPQSSPSSTAKESSNSASLPPQRKTLPIELKNLSSLCPYQDDLKKQQNCLALISQIHDGKLPKAPMIHALKTLRDAHLKNCDGINIKNGCQIFVSHLDKKVEGFSNRSPAYFINLCSGDPTRNLAASSPLVTKTWINRGTGSAKGNYRDKNGAKTTLPGLFVAGKLTAYHPYQKSRSKYRRELGYKTNDPRCKDKASRKNNWLATCPVLRLSLLNLGGAATDHEKPMHTSPFKSSNGCPSVKKEDNWIMRVLIANGPSIYTAYTNQKKYQKKMNPDNYCKNTSVPPRESQATDSNM